MLKRALLTVAVCLCVAIPAVRAATSSTITLQVTKYGSSVTGSGKVTPSSPDRLVTVDLYRLSGASRYLVASKQTRLSAASTYSATFTRSSGTSCAMRARFHGSASAAPSTAEVVFTC